jgi:iron(III) transport system substrate-binding protein
MLGEEAQTHFADNVKEYPLAAGVEEDPLLVPIAQIQQPEVELTELNDLEGTLTLLQDAGAL